MGAIFITARVTFPHSYTSLTIYTFEQWTALSDCSNYSASCELANRELHEQQRNAADEQGDEVWQQENA
jgi:hypothetical protein